MASGRRNWPEMASRSHRGDPGFGIVGLVQHVYGFNAQGNYFSFPSGCPSSSQGPAESATRLRTAARR